MNLVFADSQYYIGILNSGDQWHRSALAAVSGLSEPEYVTTEAVLTEVLAFFSEFGPRLRVNAADAIETILADEKTEVLPITSDTFVAGLSLYRNRPDKNYSLTDCISMNICRERRITKVLTHDHHFSQEGLTVLM